MKRIFAGLVITSHVFALTASNSNDVSIAATQQVQAAATQNTLVQLLSQSQNESPADDMHTGDFYAMAEWHGDIMNDVAVTYEVARQIAIDHANISPPFITYFHGHTTLPNGNQFWRVHIDSHSGVYDIHVDVFTGEVIRSR